MNPDERGRWLPEWLGRRAAVAPDQLVLITPGERLTFAELHAAVVLTARRLAAIGIGPGDRVAVLLRSGRAFVEIVHALPLLGAVLVPINTRLTAAEVTWQLADVGACTLVYDAGNAPTAAAVARQVPDLKRVAVSTEAVAYQAALSEDAVLTRLPEAEVALARRVDLAAVHSIVYTSGTTGRPKGVMLTCGNHWWSAVGSALNLGLHAGDRWLACLPLFHVAGLSILMRGVIYGIPALVHEAFDPAAVNRAIDEDGVTIVSVVSNMLQRMLEQRGDRPYPATLRSVLVGGGPVPRPLLEACTRRRLPVLQTYGLTETASQVVTLSPEDALRKLGSAGMPLLPNEIRIERDGGEAAAGEIGEILVRGPSCMAGYFGLPEETERALRDGWLHTGDLGYLDRDGYLFVVDRRTDLIISGGENVYPAEVEAALLAHPAVEEAGVRGIPDERWGQVPAAAVKLRPGAAVTAEELTAFLRERLAAFKVPVRIRFVDALPRNAANKLLRRALEM